MTADKTRRRFLLGSSSIAALALAGCVGNDDSSGGDGMGDGDEGMDTEGDGTDTGENGMTPTDPAEAPRAEIGRFSQDAGTLLVRTGENGLPGPDEPINSIRVPLSRRDTAPTDRQSSTTTSTFSRRDRHQSTPSSTRTATRSRNSSTSSA